MEAFTTLTGLVVPLDRVNVNTDEITPARFLKTIRRTGFGPVLFANWRYLDTAGQSPNPDFVLNQPRYQGGSILLSTHILSDIQVLADEITIVKQGQIIYTGPKKENVEKLYKELFFQSADPNKKTATYF